MKDMKGTKDMKGSRKAPDLRAPDRKRNSNRWKRLRGPDRCTDLRTGSLSIICGCRSLRLTEASLPAETFMPFVPFSSSSSCSLLLGKPALHWSLRCGVDYAESSDTAARVISTLVPFPDSLDTAMLPPQPS